MELGNDYNLSLSNLSLKEDSIFNYISDYQNAFWFDSGRSALKHIAKHLKNDDNILLPEFICESVSNCFPPDKTGYYGLNNDFTVNLIDLKNKINEKTKLIFLKRYFGALQPPEILNEIKLLANQHGCAIVEDTTHSIFSQKSTIGDYMVCSIRKWMPVPRGGLLYYASDSQYLALTAPDYPNSTDNRRAYGMMLKDMYLNDGLDYNADYRRIFAASEHLIDQQTDIGMMSDFARFIASCVSIEDLMQRRRKNYELLSDLLSLHGIQPALSFGVSDIPLAYPLRVHGRDALRSYLMDNKIYCAVHWPFDNTQPDSRPFALKNSQELISLPIDQRYNNMHIEYLSEIILKNEGDLLF